MKRCVGIVAYDYMTNRDGARFNVSPMLHYPDFCPFYAVEVIGDCIKKCRSTTWQSRPCIIAFNKHVFNKLGLKVT